MRLDHVYICGEVGAPHAQRLIDLGWREGPTNSHPGQGTANRRFFFDDFMLELLWMRDSEEVHSCALSRVDFYDRLRWKQTGFSPFGIALSAAAEEPLPFRTWDYQPPYLPANLTIRICDEPLQPAEPLIFVIPEEFAGASSLPAGQTNPQHVAGARIHIARHHTLSEPLHKLAEVPRLSFAPAFEHLLELTLDPAPAEGDADLRPDLPLWVVGERE